MRVFRAFYEGWTLDSDTDRASTTHMMPDNPARIVPPSDV